MKYEWIPEQGNWYKVNMHCHTTVSDGKMTPEEVKAAYRALGYDAVCFTDHEVLVPHEELCDDSFVALHGYEAAIKQDIHAHTGLFMPVYHFNMLARRQDARIIPRCYRDNPSVSGNWRYWMDTLKPYDEQDLVEEPKYDKEWLSDYLCAVRDAGFLITYNHPQWSLQSYNDYVGLKGLHAIETINGCCTSLNDNTSLHYEQMLRAGMDVLPVGGDDNHNAGGIGHGWTMIKAPELTYEALVDAYERGDCYATEGPSLLGLTLEDGELVIRTSPVASIHLMSQGRYRCVRYEQDLTEVRFPYCPENYGRYFRIELRDASGKCAFSRAFSPAEAEKCET